MDVKLVVEKGKTRTRTLKLRTRQTIVGRQKGSGLRIPSNQVSRRHCQLTVQDGYLTVEDLDSVNGTLLNGQRVSGRQVVRPGDRLEVGPVCFVVEYQLTQAAIDKMLQESGQPVPDDNEELDVLPVVDGYDPIVEALELPSDDGEVELEVEAEAIEDEPAGQQPASPNLEALEPLPMEEAFDGMADGWKLPESDDLRDLLSKMEDKPKSGKH